jgi:hypothetical protein
MFAGDYRAAMKGLAQLEAAQQLSADDAGFEEVCELILAQDSALPLKPVTLRLLSAGHEQAIQGGRGYSGFRWRIAARGIETIEVRLWEPSRFAYESFFESTLAVKWSGRIFWLGVVLSVASLSLDYRKSRQ